MKKLSLFISALTLAGMAQAQPIQTWSRYLDVTVNTTASGGGAGTATNVANFPLLVRLDSANATALLAEALSGGADLRVASEAGVQIPHQIVRWSATKAEIWVRVPSVTGNGSTKVRLYWGKVGASSTSSSASVFDSAGGFTGVWQMNEGTGDTAIALGAGTTADATANALHFTRHSDGRSAPGVVGFSRFYNAGLAGFSSGLDSAGTTAGSLATYKADSINNNAAFQAKPNAAITMSAWVKRLAGNNGASGIFGHFRYTTSNVRSYSLLRNGTAYRVLVSTGGTGDDVNVLSTANYGAGTNGTWHHVLATISATDGVRLYVNGVLETSNTSPAQPFEATTAATARPLIGALERNFNQRFIGLLDELRFSNQTVRSADWAKLDYETQKSGATAVTVGAAQNNDTSRVFLYALKSASYPQSVAITPNTPYIKAGNNATAFSINPGTLPTGLSFNTSNGTISGTPSVVTSATQYIVTATIGGNPHLDTITISVFAGSPPGAPTGAAAVAGSSAATVTWAAPASPGTSAITSYQVRAVEDTTKTCTWTTGALSCNVTGLSNGTSYTFVVRAANTFGFGPFSAASGAAIPSGPPTPPLNVTAAQAGTAASVKVNWSAPASTGGQDISDYYVTAAPGGLQCYGSPFVSPLTCTITGLTYNTAYTFTVIAANPAGNSAASAPSNSVTPVGILQGPFAIQVTGSAKPFTFALTPEAMASTEALTMTISDVYGRTVWSKTVNPKTDLIRELRWNSTTSTGRAVSAGVYMVRVSAVSGGQTSDFIQKAVSDK